MSTLAREADQTPVLELRDIRKQYGAVAALRGVNMTVGAGEVVALLGDNGAGKSTLVKIISGSVEPSSGEIRFLGKGVQMTGPADAKALGIETVYQDLSLCMNADVVANFFMGREITRRVLGIPVLCEAQMFDETQAAMRDVGTTIRSMRAKVENLSGGQRQAIELARFIHWGGKLVLLDEPFAALGVEQTRRGLDLIAHVKSRGISVIVITHNMLHALQVADRIIVLRQGVIAGNVTPAETTAEGLVRMITGEFAQ